MHNRRMTGSAPESLIGKLDRLAVGRRRAWRRQRRKEVEVEWKNGEINAKEKRKQIPMIGNSEEKRGKSAKSDEGKNITGQRRS